jgi:uncharacterized protein
MRIGILSDSHDQVQRTKSAVSLLAAAGAEALIHCGDITGPDVVYECTLLPTYFVFGNCDFDQDVLRKAIARIGANCLERGGLITLDARRIAVTHGDSEREIHRLTALKPDYLFTGHTHVVADLRKNGIRHINPGALHRAPRWTVACLDLLTDTLDMLTISNETMHP